MLPKLGARFSRFKSSAATGLKFKECKGKAKRQSTTSKPGSRWVVRRSGQCPKLDLNAFQKVAQSRGRPPQPQAQDTTARQQPAQALPRAVQQVPRVDIEAELQPLDLANRALHALVGCVTKWQGKSEAARLHPGSAIHLREAALAGNAAIALSNKLSADIHALRPSISEDDRKTLEQGWMRMAIQCCLPGMDLKVQDSDKLVTGLLKLDAMFAKACAPGGYRVDRLLALIANHGRIREFAASDATSAVQGMKALVDTMLDALGEGRDGSELDCFYGLDADLDPALKAVRLLAATDAMLQGAARANGVPVPDISAGDKLEAENDAKWLSEHELEIAKAKQRIRRALEATGHEHRLSSLSGIRVDASLVKALRDSRDKKMRASGVEVGVILAALMAMQRELAESQPAQRRLMGLQLDSHANPKCAALNERRAEGLRDRNFPTRHRGLAESELVALGLLRKDAAQACETLRDWTTRGISNADQVERALRRFDRVQRVVGKQDKAFKRSLDVLDAGPQGGRARQLGEVLVRRLTGTNDNIAANVSLSFASFDRRAMARSKKEATNAGNKLREASQTLSGLGRRDEGFAVAETSLIAALQRLDQSLAQRRAIMGEGVARVMDTAILAATLAHIGDTAVDQFRPADHVEAITATLEAWGLPVGDLQPEIEHFLSQSFGAAELNDWVERLDIRREEVKVAASNSRELASKEVRARLQHALENLQDDSRLRITRGTRVDGQSGSIPLAGPWSLNVKASVGAFAGIEISQNFEAYELVVREGTDGKGAVDASLKLWGAAAVGAKASVTATLEGSGATTKSTVVRFPLTAEGRDAMRDLVAKMVSGQKIGPEDFAGANNMRPSKERKVQGRAAVAGKLGVDVGSSAVGGAIGKFVGAGASVTLQAGVWGQYVQSRSANTNVSFVKRTRSVGMDITAAAAIGARGSEPGSGWSASLDVVDASASLQWEYKAFDLPTYLGDGLLSKNTCRGEQMVMPAGPLKEHAARAMGSNALGQLLDKLDAGNDADRVQAANIHKLIKSAGVNDVLNIRRLIDPRVRAYANDLIARAQALRAGRMAAASPEKEASKLEAQVQALLDDDDNYYVERVQILALRETTDTEVAFNAALIKASTYTEDHGEFAKEEMKFTPPQ
jgi:hypothetical protein